MAPERLGRPREPDARLKIQPAVVSVVQAAIAVNIGLIRVLYLTGERRKVGLPVIHFHPRRVHFVAQPQVQRQGMAHAEVVLHVSPEHGGTLSPGSRASNPAPELVRQSQEEVRFTGAGR